MNLESVIQSEVSQKEKKKCHMLTHMYGILKSATDEPSGRAGLKTQAENPLEGTGGGEGEGEAGMK